MFPLIHLNETLKIPTYTTIIALTTFILIYLSVLKAKSKKLSKATTLDLCLSIIIGGFLGARLFHIFYEGLDYYIKNPWDILKLWQGGFVYYGGVIGSTLLTWIVIKRKKLKFFEWADFFAPLASLGYALGRIGCFSQGCCYGKPSSLPWAVDFYLIPVHPTQLYAIFMELSIFSGLIFLERKKTKIIKPAGSLFFIWIFFHGIGRLIMEHFRNDFRGDLIWGLSISSLISLVLITLSMGGFFWLRNSRK